MSLEMNNSRLVMLRKYNGTISIEGESETEIVVRIRFTDPEIAEMAYNKLVDAVDG